ncbi:MAG: serine/threonine-protein kinase [Methylovirgula sp.]
MTALAEIDAKLVAFLTGKLTFDSLVDGLRVLGTQAEDGLVGERLRDFVNIGRLPPDLAALILGDLSRQPAKTPVAATPPPAAASKSPPRQVPDVAPPLQKSAEISTETLRNKVDEVVLSALVADFKGLRDRRRPAETTADRGLDSMLSEFRSVRLRRDAASAGRNEPRRADPTAPLPETESRLPGAGEMLKGRFVLDGVLGRGGMGTVFRAVDRRRLEALHTHPYVAIKLLSGDFRRHPEAFRTLEAEARKAQALSHPNIVTVFDFDRDGPSTFLVMELLEGEPLDKLLRANRDGLGEAALPIIEGICAGLAHAHARGVIHADLKPANVFLCADRIVKLLDFGIASATQDGGFDPATLGSFTPVYASPEILRGAPRQTQDDIYALGVLAYELYCGAHPYDRKPADVAQKEGLRPQRLAGLAKRPWQTIEKALSFDGKRRPANAAAFLQGLTATGFLGRLWPI